MYLNMVMRGFFAYAKSLLMSTRQSPDLSGILPAASGDSVRQIDCKTEEEFIMSMIRVENITFSYPSSFDPVFENVSFQIDTEWKLGLVGRNGRGKTTLLKLLLGEYEYRGKITGAVTFDYFPFPVSDKTQMTEGILRQVCQNARQWELIRELSYLGIESEVLWRPFETMSNGEQTKALLAALFLKEEHFLLIDEPTNHLDVEGRRQMADYLKRKRDLSLFHMTVIFWTSVWITFCH